MLGKFCLVKRFFCVVYSFLFSHACLHFSQHTRNGPGYCVGSYGYGGGGHGGRIYGGANPGGGRWVSFIWCRIFVVFLCSHSFCF